MSRTSAMVIWLATRGLVLVLLFGPHAWVTGDVGYFASSLSGAPDQGLSATLVEYPLPGVALVAFPWLLAEWAGRPDLYAEMVLGLALATDAAFAVLLHVFGRARRRPEAEWVWLLAVPLLGATTYARFDLVPGVLAALGVLLLVRRPWVAAAAATLATGLKLWPALLLPAMAARTRERGAVMRVAGLLGGALAAGSLALAGWDRLVSPLTWQVDRGLQIESVAATPAMVAWALGPGHHAVAYSSYNAFQISGPGVGALLGATMVATGLLVVGLAWGWWRAWRSGPELTVDAVVWLCLTAVCGFMVVGKVLSPQYLLWLLPLVAAGLAVVETRRGLVGLRLWAVLLLLATGTTQLVFPVFYGGLSSHGPDSARVVLLLVARNAMLVGLLVLAVRETWWHLVRQRGTQRGIALERQPRGPEGSDARTLR